MLALVAVALSLGLDNFGAATAIGAESPDRTGHGKVVLTFGAFEGGMPVVGILLGRSLAGSLGVATHPVAGGILSVMGLYIMWSGMHAGRRPTRSIHNTRLVVLAVILSLDNLVIGFALGTDRISVVVAAIVFGVVSAALTAIGLELGRSMRARFGEWSEVLGGVVLLGVGAAILAGT